MEERPLVEGERAGTAARDRRTLRLLLAINAVLFVVELVAGLIAESSGLLADSLDMLADAGVYGAALLVVGSSAARKALAATASGIVQLSLAATVAADVGRRWLHGSEPLSSVMIAVSLLALAGNAACVLLLREHRDADVHMRASWIFSTTDVQVNVGVMLAGALVVATGSRLPDLLVGLAITVLVIRGGTRILREAARARTGLVSPPAPEASSGSGPGPRGSP